MQLADTVLVMCILMSAYFIRGITGFGSALISVPLLALSQPLQFAIPLVLALDFTASVVLGSTNTKKANWSEIKILLPAGHPGGQKNLDLGPVGLLRVGAPEDHRGREVERQHQRNRELQRLGQREQRDRDQRRAEARDPAYEVRAHQNAHHQHRVSQLHAPEIDQLSPLVSLRALASERPFTDRKR